MSPTYFHYFDQWWASSRQQFVAIPFPNFAMLPAPDSPMEWYMNGFPWLVVYEPVSPFTAHSFISVYGLPTVVAYWTRGPQPLWWAACSCVCAVHWLCLADDQAGTYMYMYVCVCSRLTRHGVHWLVAWQVLSMCEPNLCSSETGLASIERTTVFGLTWMFQRTPLLFDAYALVRQMHS